MEPDLSPEQRNVSMKSQEHLEKWTAAQRPFVIFNGPHLVKALPWPHGHQAMQQICSAYEQERKTIPMTDEEYHRDTLSHDEMKQCAAWLAEQIRVGEPDWTI